MSNQDSDDRKPSRFTRLMAATAKTSGDSGLSKKDSENEPKSSGGRGRGALLQMAVCMQKKKLKRFDTIIVMNMIFSEQLIEYMMYNGVIVCSHRKKKEWFQQHRHRPSPPAAVANFCK